MLRWTPFPERKNVHGPRYAGPGGNKRFPPPRFPSCCLRKRSFSYTYLRNSWISSGEGSSQTGLPFSLTSPRAMCFFFSSCRNVNRLTKDLILTSSAPGGAGRVSGGLSSGVGKVVRVSCLPFRVYFMILVNDILPFYVLFRLYFIFVSTLKNYFIYFKCLKFS